MNVRAKNLSWLFLRPWLGVSLVIWVAVSVAYYWWLISGISVLENQNNVFKAHLRTSIEDMESDQVLKHSEERLCETVHIAMSCMSRCSSLVTPMLKSLLLHRQQPLHFHLVVDNTSNRVLTKLFDTWDLPDVKYTCYNAEYYLNKIRWIPNSHYSGIYALVKLLFPRILPEELSKVIVLDSDLTFQSDVAELWWMFSNNMTDEQFIGLVENESGWYLGDGRWPALGRGFNTGVILLDLYKLRHSTDWDSLWRDTVNKNLETLKNTQLADQDVINAIIKRNPKIVYRISCKYNVQMSTKTQAKNCYGEDTSNIKIIHWNSPTKHNIRIKDAEYFRNIYQSYVNFDGNLLKEKLHRCSQPETVTYKMNNTDLCLSFRAASRVNLRTHLYYMDYSYTSVDNFDITLVVQLSMDRLQFLDRLVKHWEGPLSAAIYLSDCEVPQLESFIREWSDTLSMRTNIGYHLVFKNSAVHYPVNYLRNVALENVDTPYVFLTDVDIVPMSGLYKHLRTATQLVNPYPRKKCLVVAAFETQRYRASPPRTKAALLSRLNEGDVAPFRAREWPKGHRATNYTRWAQATRPYEVEWESDYESYLVVHRSVPKYDTRFSGFGWNKVSHGVELRARGWRPLVLPGAFVLHTPHAPSHDSSAFRRDPTYRACLSLLKQEFMQDLKQKYNITFEEPKQESSDAGLAKALRSSSLIYEQIQIYLICHFLHFVLCADIYERWFA